MHRHVFSELPDNYSLYYHFNIRSDFDLLKTLSRLEIIISLLLLLIGLNVVPIRSAYREVGSREFGLEILAVLVGYFGLMFVHEKLHHLAMKAFGSKSATFNKTIGEGFSGSKDYFDKLSYIIISIIPFILITTILILACCYVQKKWFWVFYALFIFNTSGSLTDFFALIKTVKSPPKSVLLDSGLEFKIFSPLDNTNDE